MNIREKLHDMGGPKDYAYDALIVSTSIAAGAFAVHFVAEQLKDNEERKNAIAAVVANTFVDAVTGVVKVANTIKTVMAFPGSDNSRPLIPDSTMRIGPDDI